MPKSPMSQHLLAGREAEAQACFDRALQADPSSRAANEADLQRLRVRCRRT